MLAADKMGKGASLKATSFAAAALAFASLGDAFLYPYLPINFLDAGIPVAWVGLLLSINRFVRIIANSIVVKAFARFGLRNIIIIAVLFAICATLGYGIATGLLAWLMFRVMWGVSFSALRIGSLAYALEQKQQGMAMGISKGIHEAGPLLALLMVPLLINNFHSKTIFFLLALSSLPALYFSWQLPKHEHTPHRLSPKLSLQWPSRVNILTFGSALFVEGIVVVVLGVLFLHYRDHINLSVATSLAAIFLAYRRVCLVIFSPVSGWLADKVGLQLIFQVSMLFVVVGLLTIVFGWIGTGAVVVFSFYSINAAITPGAASAGKAHLLTAVAENATWRDLGAAIGTLVGGLLIPSPTYLAPMLLAGAVGIKLFLCLHFGIGKSRKLFYPWK